LKIELVCAAEKKNEPNKHRRFGQKKEELPTKQAAPMKDHVVVPNVKAFDSNVYEPGIW